MIRSNPFTIFAGIDEVPADYHQKESGWAFLPWALRDAGVPSHTIDEIETELVDALNHDDETRVKLVLADISDSLERVVTKVIAHGRSHLDAGREWMVYVAA